MFIQPLQTVSPEELVDFEDQRNLFEMMLDPSAKKRLMFIQGSGMCGKTSLLHMVRFRCEQANIPCCRIDFRGKSYDNPHFTLVQAICDELGLLPSYMAQALQPLSSSKVVGAQATTSIEGDVTDSSIITQILMTVSLTHGDLRQAYMIDRLMRAFTADLTAFVAKKRSVVCLFDTVEDISAEDENWLLNALLSPIAKGEFKGVMVVVAGRRWPKIEPWQWEDHAHLIEGLPRMSVEHIKTYAQKVGVTITDQQAENYWRDSKGGHPLIMAMKIKPF
jgi:hypothetical protein